MAIVADLSGNNPTIDETFTEDHMRQKIAVASSGNNALVAAIPGRRIRVLAYNFITNGAVNVKFQSDGAGTPVDLTGLKYCAAAGQGISVPFVEHGWFQTGIGKSLDINLSGAVAVGGELVWEEA